jgi:hypothetical protein
VAAHQPSLFSAAESPGRYASQPIEPLQMSAETLQAWKAKVQRYQQQAIHNNPPQQASLFDPVPTVNNLAEQIDPFKLPLQNTEFWRWKAEDQGVSALYFVIDQTGMNPDKSLLLYVGETIKSNQRWKGEHDCKRYILNYVSAHRQLGLSVSVNISFWADAPVDTHDRQSLESALIYRWRSPFNKQNWTYWNTPFIGKKA